MAEHFQDRRQHDEQEADDRQQVVDEAPLWCSQRRRGRRENASDDIIVADVFVRRAIDFFCVSQTVTGAKNGPCQEQGGDERDHVGVPAKVDVMRQGLHPGRHFLRILANDCSIQFDQRHLHTPMHG